MFMRIDADADGIAEDEFPAANVDVRMEGTDSLSNGNGIHENGAS